MKTLNTFAKVMTCFLAGALVISALPSSEYFGASSISGALNNATDIDSTQGVSPRGVGELSSIPQPPQGINCDGNFGCAGGYCPSDANTIKNIVDKLDDNAVFKNYQNIACARCATQEERPADYRQGICVYATKLKGAVTGKVVKNSVNALIEHGCTRCGSVPVVPGAKDDTDGDIQINFTRGACETGLCHGPRGKIEQGSAVSSQDDYAFSEVESGDESSVEPSDIPGISPRSAAPDSAVALLGINCRGSTMCSNFGCHWDALVHMKPYVDALQDGVNDNYRNGELIACVECGSNVGKNHAGICLFGQKIPKGADLDRWEIQSAFKALQKHGCKWCGSCPLYKGNNVNKGELTLNYVHNGCGDGICGRY